MTRDEVGKAIEDNQLTEKLTNRLIGRYPKYKDYAEDIAQAVLARAARKPEAFPDVPRLTAYVFEISDFKMIDRIRKEAARRKVAKRTLMVTTAKSYNPARHLEWKVDLERAIDKITNDLRVKQALWHNVYEKYTIEEVVSMMPGDVSKDAWDKRIDRAKSALKQEMKRKGYNLD